jgi:hypothetical protein
VRDVVCGRSDKLDLKTHVGEYASV